jgi:hypothetical protein
LKCSESSFTNKKDIVYKKNMSEVETWTPFRTLEDLSFATNLLRDSTIRAKRNGESRHPWKSILDGRAKGEGDPFIRIVKEAN